MKKVILILAIATMFTNCKKSTTAPATPTEVTCVFVINGGSNGTSRYFYKCTSSVEELIQVSKDLRDKGLEYESIKKSTCSQCQ